MLKLSTTKTSVAKTEVVCSEEALIESIHAVSAASEEFFSAAMEGAEIEQVLANLEMCAHTVKECGLSKTVIAAFNSEGELSACVGEENLTVAGLESLNGEAVKELSAKYSAGLEGKVAEVWNKVVAWLRNMWTKFVNWVKSIFTNRAKFVSVLETVKSRKDEDFDMEAKFEALHPTKKIVAAAEKSAPAIDKFVKAFITNYGEGMSEADAEAASKAADDRLKVLEGEEKEVTLKKIGFATPAEFKMTVAAYIKLAKKSDMMNLSKAIDKQYQRLIKMAGEIGKAEGDQSAAKANYQHERKRLEVALKIQRMDNTVVMRTGAELVKQFKGSKKKAAETK